MDYHDLQRKLFEIEPSNPAEDLAKLQALGGGAAQPAPQVPTQVVESYNAPEGSLPLDRDYSVSDFAALAGVTSTPKVIQPIIESQDNTTNVQDKDARIAQLEERVARLEELLTEKSVSKAQQQAAGIALAAKRKGKTPKGDGAAAQMSKMSMKDLEDFAGTKHKGLPKKKKTETRSIKDELMAKLAEYELKK